MVIEAVIYLVKKSQVHSHYIRPNATTGILTCVMGVNQPLQ